MDDEGAGGRPAYDVVIIGSVGVNPGMRLVGNPDYPTIAEDFMRSFKVLRALPADVPLGSHPGMFNMAAKHARLAAGGPNPYIDPQGYKAEIDLVEATFKSVLEEQRKAAVQVAPRVNRHRARFERGAYEAALALGALMVIARSRSPAQAPGVTYVAADKVAAALAKGGSLATAPGLTVSGNHREGPGQVEVHDTETDIFYIVEGTATIVTGGTMVGGKQTARASIAAPTSGRRDTAPAERRRDGDSGRDSPLVQGGLADDQLLDGEGAEADRI